VVVMGMIIGRSLTPLNSSKDMPDGNRVEVDDEPHPPGTMALGLAVRMAVSRVDGGDTQ
jgi:hypothetical protein